MYLDVIFSRYVSSTQGVENEKVDMPLAVVMYRKAAVSFFLNEAPSSAMILTFLFFSFFLFFFFFMVIANSARVGVGASLTY